MNIADIVAEAPPPAAEPPLTGFTGSAIIVLLIVLTGIQLYRTFTRLGGELHAPDARGWIGIGVFTMSGALLLMMFLDKPFREDEFVQTIATLVIGTGFVGGAVSWAYAATKGGGEAAESSARIAETVAGVPAERQPAAAGAPANDAPAGTEADPIIVAGAPEGTPAVRTKPEKKS